MTLFYPYSWVDNLAGVFISYPLLHNKVPKVWQLKTTSRSVGQKCGHSVVSGITGEVCSDAVECRCEADVAHLGTRSESYVETVSQLLPALRVLPVSSPSRATPMGTPHSTQGQRTAGRSPPVPRSQCAHFSCWRLPCPGLVGAIVWGLPQPGLLYPSHWVTWPFPPMLQGLVLMPVPSRSSPRPISCPGVATWPSPCSLWSSWHSAIGDDQTRAFTLLKLLQETIKCPSFVYYTESKNLADLTVLPLSLNDWL